MLCLTVPFVALYAAFAVNGAEGLLVGVVPLGGALLLLGTAQWPSDTRAGVTFGALVATIVYSIAVVAWVAHHIGT